VLSQLICITWESAVLPCACALAALVSCLRGVRVAPLLSTTNLRSRADMSHVHLRRLISLTGPSFYKLSSVNCMLFRCSRPCAFILHVQIFCPSHRLVSIARTREVRAKLAEVVNHTHFPTLTDASRLDERWSVPQDGDECDQSESRRSHIPVHVCRLPLCSLFLLRALTLHSLQLALVPCKIGTAGNSAVEGSEQDSPPV
jgi:hypothetical protein